MIKLINKKREKERDMKGVIYYRQQDKDQCKLNVHQSRDKRNISSRVVGSLCIGSSNIQCLGDAGWLC